MKNYRVCTSLVAVLAVLLSFPAVAQAVAVTDPLISEKSALENISVETQFSALFEQLRAIDADETTDNILRIERAKDKYAFISMTEEERTAYVRSQKAKMIQNSLATRSAAYSLQLSYMERLPVPHYTQENLYYCGPATAKQTIAFMSDESINPSQSEIAQAIGTTTNGSSTTSIQKWLAKYGYDFVSVPVASMTVQDLDNYVYSAVSAYQSPVFGAIAVKNTTSNLIYPTTGHILNISGIMYDGVNDENDQLELTDPYITWVTSIHPTGKYFVPIDEYKNVMTSFWW